MFIKNIKLISIMCICILVTPITVYGVDPEGILNFMFKSSNPEVKQNDEETIKIEVGNPNATEDNTQNHEENHDKNTDEDKCCDLEPKDTSKEDDFIKLYIGEENIPKEEIKSKDLETMNTQTSKYLSGYTNREKITGKDPTLFIYHTHAGETYNDSPEGNYHSQHSEDKSVLAVGSLVTDYLDQMGWNVIHNVEYNDYPEFNRSYINSLDLIKRTLKKHESIDIAIDIHRDGMEVDTKERFANEKERMTTTINGE